MKWLPTAATNQLPSYLAATQAIIYVGLANFDLKANAILCPTRCVDSADLVAVCAYELIRFSLLPKLMADCHSTRRRRILSFATRPGQARP